MTALAPTLAIDGHPATSSPIRISFEVPGEPQPQGSSRAFRHRHMVGRKRQIQRIVIQNRSDGLRSGQGSIRGIAQVDKESFVTLAYEVAYYRNTNGLTGHTRRKN